jgi:hypothetical protein
MSYDYLPSPANTQADELTLHNLSNSFLRYVESALIMLEDEITHLGTSYTHYWYISTAYGLVTSKLSSGNATVPKQQAINKVARQYFKVRASQEGLPQAKEKMLLSRVSKIRR